MKVMFVGSDSAICGAGFSMIKLIEEEKRLGIDVIPIVKKGNTESILTKKQIRHYTVNAHSWIVSNEYPKFKILFYRFIKTVLNIPCFFRYCKIIKKENPDIIHINALTTYTIALSAIVLKKPIVWHIRELIEEDLNGTFWNKKRAYKLMMKADYFIAISKCVENKYKNLVGNDKIECIYNGIDKNLFYCESHTIFCSDKIVITMAGRIVKEKGQGLCLKELAPLIRKNKNLILQFAGVGDERNVNELKNICKRENLPSSQVLFLGYVKDMSKLWQNTDIAIIYSKYEAFGRVTIEAKMAGALVLGYNSGGTSELIEDKIDGFLFDHNNTLYNILVYVLNHKNLCRSVANVGRSKAVNIFTSKNNANNVYRVYKMILNKKCI